MRQYLIAALTVLAAAAPAEASTYTGYLTGTSGTFGTGGGGSQVNIYFSKPLSQVNLTASWYVACGTTPNCAGNNNDDNHGYYTGNLQGLTHYSGGSGNPYIYIDSLWGSFKNPDGNPIHYSVSFSTPGVPEPTTWAMMLTGIGMIGCGLRRRRQNSLAALTISAELTSRDLAKPTVVQPRYKLLNITFVEFPS